MSDNLATLIVGTGPIAKAHLKALKALSQSVVVVGRSVDRAAAFSAETGTEALPGGIQSYFEHHPAPKNAIVCVQPELLSSISVEVLEAGVQRVLVEKPGGLSLAELSHLEAVSLRNHQEVYIAYNRRFYDSVERCTQFIKEDGGVQTFHFDFTELADKIGTLGKSERVLSRWFEANSTPRGRPRLFPWRGTQGNLL